MTWFYWSILSAMFAGVTAVLAKAGTRDVKPDMATAIRTTVLLVLAWGIAFATGSTELTTLKSREVTFLVLSGVTTALSWVCYFRAIHAGDVSTVAPVDKLSLVFTVALAAVFLREELVWQHWIGGGLMVAGAMIMATI